MAVLRLIRAVHAPPLTSTFIPLVPQASQGRRGVLIQTSPPCTRRSVQMHFIVTEEDHMGAGLGPPDAPFRR